MNKVRMAIDWLLRQIIDGAWTVMSTESAASLVALNYYEIHKGLAYYYINITAMPHDKPCSLKGWNTVEHEDHYHWIPLPLALDPAVMATVVDFSIHMDAEKCVDELDQMLSFVSTMKKETADGDPEAE